MKRILFLLLCIPLFTEAQIITTIAGTGSTGYSGDGGPAIAAKLSWISSVFVDNLGNVYIADQNNNCVRKIYASGIITTIAGTVTAGYSGDGGPATAAKLKYTQNVTLDNSGNVYIADQRNNRVRKVDLSGIITTIAGTGIAGYSGDGGPATVAKLNWPVGVAVDKSGNIYVAEYYNACVRKINPGGIITTIAGTGIAGYSGDGGMATLAQLRNPETITVDNSGNIYIADCNNFRIRKVNSSGVITTIVGTGVAGFNGDGGPATAARIGNSAVGINQWGNAVMGNSGNIYIADYGNNCIRMINTLGIITTIAGNGTATYSGDAGPASAAGLGYACFVSVDQCENLYICESQENVVRKVSMPITGVMPACPGQSFILSDATSGGSWSSSDTLIATISSTGKVSAVTFGTATITYMTASCGSFATTVTIDSGSYIISGSITICAGSMITLSSAIAGGTWSSSNTAIATVTSGGDVTGITVGTAVITYLTSACTAYTTNVIITPSPEAGIIIGTSSVCAGTTITLSDTASGGVWRSSNTSLATVSGGVVTGVTPGIVTISYSVTNACGNSLATYTITINPLPDAGTIIPNFKNAFCIGQTITVSETITGGIWSMSNGKATISGTTLTAVTAGADTILYSVSNSCGTNTAAFPVTVVPLQPPILGNLAVCVGDTTILSDSLFGGMWYGSSSGIGIVYLQPVIPDLGLIAGISPGTAIITYTMDLGCTTYTTVTVLPLPDAGTISGASTVCEGAMFNLSETVLNGRWKSGNSNIAKIDSITGAINALNTGAAIITYTTTNNANNCINSATFPITVTDSLLVTANITNDACKEGLGSIGIDVKGGTDPIHYLWSNNAAGNNITGLSAGTYTLVVTDINNCIKTSAYTVEDICMNITIHDVITPNGDGINDVWIIEGIQNYPENTVQVFDKWGTMLYEKNSYNNDWSGKGSNGELLPDGTYFYLIKLNAHNTTGGKNIFTGSILIKR